MTPERFSKINRVLNLRQPDMAIVMENVHDPHNIAAVMRTCDAVGVQNLYVLNNTIKPHKKFGKKSSASAVGWLSIHTFTDTDACFEALRKKYNKIYATHLGVSSQSLYDLDLTESVALVFGNEHHGVTDEALAKCDGNFIIPQVGMIQSLNISVACAISLYEGYRQRSNAGFYNGTSRMNSEEYAGLQGKWGLLDDSGAPIPQP